jgi:hypothetical protein
MTPKQIEALWVQAGGPKDAAPLMAAIAIAESGGNTDALNNNPATKDYSVGLWQINYYNGLYSDRTARYGPPQALYGDTTVAAMANARAAVNLYDGGKGIGNWQGDPAYAAYQANGDAGLKPFLGYTPTGTPADPGSSSGGGGGVFSGIENAIKFVFSVRMLEVLGGGIMILLGLYLLARQVGLNVPRPPLAAAVSHAAAQPTVEASVL